MRISCVRAGDPDIIDIDALPDIVEMRITSPLSDEEIDVEGLSQFSQSPKIESNCLSADESCFPVAPIGAYLSPSAVDFADSQDMFVACQLENSPCDDVMLVDSIPDSAPISDCEFYTCTYLICTCL